MNVMTFGAACSPACAQFVKNTHALKYSERYARATEAIVDRHYVDDWIDSFDTEEECRRVISEVVQIHNDAGFNIRGFVSNCRRVLQDVSNDNVEQSQFIEMGQSDSKVLGMWWNISEDEIKYKLDKDRMGTKLITLQEIPTKRMVLRAVMMIFDPMGLLTYLIMQGKLILKAIWRSGIDWDEQLQESEWKKWQVWVRSLSGIEKFRVRRWYFSSVKNQRYELHIFVDAGEEAIAAVAYLIRETPDEREVALVAAKSKVAPNRPMSIPRLELQAAVVGVRLGNSLVENMSLPITKRYFWTDSRNVLCWLRSPRRFKIFVAHRIGEIRESSKIIDWRWVPGDLNIADLATKTKSFTNGPPTDWIDGPIFLRKSIESWPAEPPNVPEIHEEDLELRCNVTSVSVKDTLKPNIERFSKYERLIRTQAYVLRWFYHKKGCTTLTQEEIFGAELYIIRTVQQEYFQRDYECLKNNEAVEKASKIKKYSPFLDEHKLIRMRSRLLEADFLPYDQRCPIILPGKHTFTSLLIESFHRKYKHANHSTVLNELRQKFVIPALRAKLKCIRSKCARCKLVAAVPSVPEMAALPRSRIATATRPFTYVGVDYFGPMLVKVGRRHEKRWGVLFTCLTTRAVHIETSSGLSANAFMLVFRCFIGRRGMPNEIFSDNGTNFHGTNNELQRLLKSNIKSGMELEYASVKWNFNPPHAPHMGGAWECLIRSVKISLGATLQTTVPSDEELRAILTEIEMMVNSRPLTYVDTTPGELEALTPNHFLLGSSSGVKPWGDFTDDPSMHKIEWKKQQNLTRIFWKRFTTEYLPEISGRTKWYDAIEPLKVGDVVAVVLSNQPYSWQLGRVVAVITSKDGAVRQVDVKTRGGILRRPVSKLAILEREAN